MRFIGKVESVAVTRPWEAALSRACHDNGILFAHVVRVE